MEKRTEREETLSVFGRNAVTELLKSGSPVDTLYLSSSSEEGEFGYLEKLAREKGAVIKRVHPKKLEALCGSGRHQGVAALTPQVSYAEVEEMLRIARDRGEAPFLILADGISDPHNLGAIIRTAECVGAHGLIFPKRNGCGVTPTVFRASAGACSYLPLARVTNLAAVIKDLKKAGVFCYCADMDGSVCTQTRLDGPIALIIGSEGFGVSRLVKDLCDGVISLPMNGRVNSLNASVAAGALMYEIIRQRNLAGKR